MNYHVENGFSSGKDLTVNGESVTPGNSSSGSFGGSCPISVSGVSGGDVFYVNYDSNGNFSVSGTSNCTLGTSTSSHQQINVNTGATSCSFTVNKGGQGDVIPPPRTAGNVEVGPNPQ